MYQLKVEGMSCGHCVNAVTQAVKEVDDAAKVDVDLAAGRVSVESTAELARIKSAIAEAGYEVED